MTDRDPVAAVKFGCGRPLNHGRDHKQRHQPSRHIPSHHDRYGSITTSICTVVQVATQAALAAKAVFPNARIGDIEPANLPQRARRSASCRGS